MCVCVYKRVHVSENMGTCGTSCTMEPSNVVIYGTLCTVEPVHIMWSPMEPHVQWNLLYNVVIYGTLCPVEPVYIMR